MKSIRQINNFLSQDDVQFIMNKLSTLNEVRNEDDTFNRSIYVVERDDNRFKELFLKCDLVAEQTYQKKLKGHQLYFIKYSKGDYIKRHNDNWNTENSAGRLYSLVAQMTHPSLYEGGNTIVYNDKETVILSKNQGDGIIFPSKMDHELTEVTEGERFSLVIMFKENLNKVVI